MSEELYDDSRETLASYDRIFKQEFSQMIKERIHLNPWCNDPRFDIVNLPVPNGLCNTELSEGAYIRGIQEPYFSSLNKTVVKIEKRQAWTKKEYDQYGNVLKDRNGRPIVKDVTIPQGSVVVSSKKNIKLPNVKIVGVSKVKYVPSDGFKYIDFEKRKDGSVIFYYAVPKIYVYKLNLVSLVISKNSRGRQSHYKGYRIVMQNGKYVYIYVIPYRNNKACRVLSIKASVNFDKEIEALISYWEQVGIIFNRQLCEVGENSRLGYAYVDGDLNIDDYVPYTESLGDVITNNDELEE